MVKTMQSHVFFAIIVVLHLPSVAFAVRFLGSIFEFNPTIALQANKYGHLKHCFPVSQ